MPHSYFKSVIPLTNNILKIEMSNNNRIWLNFSPLMYTTRFWPLQDQAVFQSVKIDGSFLVFGKKVRIGATEIMDLVLFSGSWAYKNAEMADRTAEIQGDRQ